jgi:hypothetical protein
MRASEDPVAHRGVGADPLPSKKVLGHVHIKRNRFGRGLRLALPDNLMPDGSSDPQLQSLEIYVLPAQRQELANAADAADP